MLVVLCRHWRLFWSLARNLDVGVVVSVVVFCLAVAEFRWNFATPDIVVHWYTSFVRFVVGTRIVVTDKFDSLFIVELRWCTVAGRSRRETRQLVVTDPVHNHVALALDGDTTALARGQVRRLFDQELVRRLGTQDAIGLGIGFHARRRIDRVPKQPVPRIQRTNHVAHDRAGMKAHPNVHVTLGRVFLVNQNLTRFVDQVNRKQRGVLRVSVGLFLFQIRYPHVRVTNRFDLYPLMSREGERRECVGDNIG